MKSDLEFCKKELALKYKSLTKKSLEKALKWSNRYYKDYITNLMKLPTVRKYEPLTKYKYVYKELLFRGFIDIRNFKTKPHCSYVITNINCKDKLIYPVHCSHDFDSFKKGYTDVYELLSQVGLAGYTTTTIRIM